MVLLLIQLFFAGMLAVSFITYLLYWYEEGSRPYGPHPGVCTRAMCILRGLLMSILSLAAVFGSYPMYLINLRRIPRRIRGADKQNPPILFVHGLYHNATAWLMYHYWFRKAGLTHTYAFSYLSFGQGYDALVQRLEKQVRKLESAAPGVKPVLVGHSLGGLVIRGWIAQGDNQSRIAGVVTLGTPHQGSKLAGLGLGRLCRSLIFRGPLIRRLEEQDITPAIPCFSLSSALDNMVLPQEGLHIRNPAWREERTPLVSHIAMLYHPATASQTIAAVRSILSASERNMPERYETATDTAHAASFVETPDAE